MASFFLRLVERAVKAPPSADSLYELLKLADPDLSFAALKTKAAREKLIKQLRVAMHPDQGGVSDTTAVFQDLTNFCEQCGTCDFSAKRRETTPGKEKEEAPAKRSRPIFPYKFNVEDQWPAAMKHLKHGREHMKEDPKIWCYNARGYIVHHALTERLAGWVYIADKFFHELPAGNDVDSIKEELTRNGPVLSASFQPSGAMMREYGLQTPSPVLIVGWRQVQGKGEVWLVRPTPQAEVVEIPVGSFSLADDVQVPKEDMRNLWWQYTKDYPYIERDFSGESDWITRSEYDMNIPYTELDSILEGLVGLGKKGEKLGFLELLTSKKQIEVCPIGLKAMSRRAEIVNMFHDMENPHHVTLSIKFIDDRV
jgi:hypothetical protein